MGEQCPECESLLRYFGVEWDSIAKGGFSYSTGGRESFAASF